MSIDSPDLQEYRTSTRANIFDLLSNDRRRHTIRYLRDQGTATLSELAEHIAAIEQEKTVEELSSSERKRVYTSLQQTHLDRLQEAGMVEIDRDSIKLTKKAQELKIYMDIVPEGSIPWNIYYIGLSIITVGIAAAFWLDIIPTELISPSVGLWIVGLLFLCSSIAHWIHERRFRFDRLGSADNE